MLGDVWVEADGIRLLVLPLRFASGPGNGQPQDLVRLQVAGAGALQCPATNVNFSDRRSCGEGDRLTYRPDDVDQQEAVAVTEPSGVTAEPDPGDGEDPMSRSRWTGPSGRSVGRRYRCWSVASVPLTRGGAQPVRPAVHGHHDRAATPTAATTSPCGRPRSWSASSQITFGGGVHDGFRLPDDGALLPPYLRAGYALTSVAAADGQPEPADFTRTNHRVEVTSHGTYPTGRHGFEVSYRVTGAAQPTERGWTVHVRLLDVVLLRRATGWRSTADLRRRPASSALRHLSARTANRAGPSAARP